MRRTFDMRTGTPRDLVLWWARHCGYEVVVTEDGRGVDSVWSSIPELVTVELVTEWGLEVLELRGGEDLRFVVSTEHDARSALRAIGGGVCISYTACQCGWEGPEHLDTPTGRRAADVDAAQHIAQAVD